MSRVHSMRWGVQLKRASLCLLLIWAFCQQVERPASDVFLLVAATTQMPVNQACRILGVRFGSSMDVLKKARRAKLRELHPDVTGDDGSHLQQALQAFEVLVNPDMVAQQVRGQPGDGKMPLQHEVGSTVQLVGLKAAIDGQQGKVIAVDPVRRLYDIRMTDGSLKTIRSENIRIVAPPAPKNVLEVPFKDLVELPFKDLVSYRQKLMPGWIRRLLFSEPACC